MRLLVINWQDRTHPLSGGAEVHLHEIFGRIAEQGHEVTLLCCGHKGAASREVLDGMQIIRIGARPWFNYAVRLWWHLVGKGLGFDLVVDDINKLPFFTPRFVDTPILALIHHFFGDSIFTEVGKAAGTYVQWFEKRIPEVYANTTICTVSNSTLQECLSLGLPPSNLHVIHNAIDQRHFPMQVTAKASVPTLAYFGRLKRYKSVHHILEALVEVKRELPDVHLDILGAGDERGHLEKLTTELGLADNVTFRGFVTDAHKAEFLAAAHVMVNPSIKEGWGITNLEANACGTPVISADVPGLRDSVLPGVSGLLYPYGNIPELAHMILHLLLDSAERQRLSEGAVQWAASFTWDRSAEEMLELCNYVLTKQTP